ncbi:unnamed protein product [Somion occarium]|uniref:Uncharacterized protein n=1 Tax=Somion occarium TaxID=3059160 RepID=A0ABP1DY38_9APHY
MSLESAGSLLKEILTNKIISRWPHIYPQGGKIWQGPIVAPPVAEPNFHKDTMLNPAWINKNRYLGLEKHASGQKAMDHIMTGKWSLYSSPAKRSQTIFGTPDSTYSSLPDTDSQSSIFSRSISRSSCTSIDSDMDLETKVEFDHVKELFERGKEMEMTHRTDFSLFQDDYDISSLQPGDMTRTGPYTQKFKHLRTIVQPPMSLDMSSIEQYVEMEKCHHLAYEIVGDDDATEGTQLGRRDHDFDEVVFESEFEEVWIGMEGDSDQAGVDSNDEDQSAQKPYRDMAIRTPAYSEVTTLEYPLEVVMEIRSIMSYSRR